MKTRILDTPARRLLAFVLGALAATALGIAAAAAILGMAGSAPPAAAMALTSGLASLALVALSRYLLRAEGAPLAALGLPTTLRRARECALGIAISAPLFLGVAWAQSLAVGAEWEFQGGKGLRAAVAGLGLALAMVLFEELLFRGVALRNLVALLGGKVAVGLAAILFGAYHLIGNDFWAMGALFQFLMPAAGGLLFGWTAIRSGGLALPIGLHLGGNWVQASVAGFSAEGGAGATPKVEALWRIRLSAGDVQALVAPDLLPRLPYLSALALAAILAWLVLRSPRSPSQSVG